jgi:N-acetylmuramoyl-L-alanine amidase
MLPPRRRPARWSWRLHLAVALCATVLPWTTASAAEPPVQGAPAQTAPGRSSHATAPPVRFVIGLEKPAEFQVFSLQNPDRVIVELPDMKMQLPLVPGDKPIGLIKSFQGGQSAPGQARVVIHLTAPATVEKAAIERGADGRSSRLVVDIAAAGPQRAAAPASPQAKVMRAGATGLGATGLMPPAPKAAQRPAQRIQNVYRPLIVLDPGHGGHDSGAQKFGTVEKDVVLAFGKVLRDKLLASGRYRVLMTRENDSFVDLDERREFAEKHKAALFIAIHADYASTSARGATIYSLRESVAESLKRSQRGAVRDKVLSGRELTPIKAEASGEATVVKGFLADLAQREVDANKDRTNVFAQSVIEFMGRSTSLRDNPDKTAAFRVLKTAQVPAVLIELAYVSNQQDATNLRSEEWRRKVTESIMTAIDNYFADPSTRVPM